MSPYQFQSLNPYPVQLIYVKMSALQNFKIENLNDMFHLKENIEGTD